MGFAGLARGRNGAFLGFAGLARGRNGAFLGFAGLARGQNGSFLGFARAASEEKGGFFVVSRCANLLRGSFLVVSRAVNSLRGSFSTLCTVCKLPARVLFYSLHGVQTPSEGPFSLFARAANSQRAGFFQGRRKLQLGKQEKVRLFALFTSSRKGGNPGAFL